MAPAGHGRGAVRAPGRREPVHPHPAAAPVRRVPCSCRCSGPGRRRSPPATWARPYRALLWTWIAGDRDRLRHRRSAVLRAAAHHGGAPRGLRRPGRSEGRVRTLGWILVPSAAITIVLAVPVLPISAVNVTATVNEAVAETVGWPELVDQVAGVVRSLPPDEQDHVVLLTLHLRRGRGHRPLRARPRPPPRLLRPQQLRGLRPADRSGRRWWWPCSTARESLDAVVRPVRGGRPRRQRRGHRQRGPGRADHRVPRPAHAVARDLGAAPPPQLTSCLHRLS